MRLTEQNSLCRAIFSSQLNVKHESFFPRRWLRIWQISRNDIPLINDCGIVKIIQQERRIEERVFQYVPERWNLSAIFWIHWPYASGSQNCNTASKICVITGCSEWNTANNPVFKVWNINLLPSQVSNSTRSKKIVFSPNRWSLNERIW